MQKISPAINEDWESDGLRFCTPTEFTQCADV